MYLGQWIKPYKIRVFLFSVTTPPWAFELSKKNECKINRASVFKFCDLGYTKCSSLSPINIKQWHCWWHCTMSCKLHLHSLSKFLKSTSRSFKNRVPTHLVCKREPCQKSHSRTQKVYLCLFTIRIFKPAVWVTYFTSMVIQHLKL